ncbi:TorD/DmsD family molecular chaperone [Desulfonatronovibrio magnus]|uniref:TorD/DmsD family molecular chaperone n=1 Tax=Desulfonatronovibrio magnus TaxID=698827 RepID=UPI0005EB0E0D|nr:molecular chaperone TorD family protein [Desulfonatronovibrio magnus]
MNEISLSRRTVEGLRDFFIAAQKQEMMDAWDKITSSLIPAPPTPDPAEWDLIEFSFNRLFVGPKAPEAPPYASVYLQNEPNLMGETTMFVRSVFEQLGVMSPWKNTLPEDHVSLELDAALIIDNHRIEHDDVDLKSIHQDFILDHLCVWIPHFCERTRKAPSNHSVINTVVVLLEKYVASELEK